MYILYNFSLLPSPCSLQSQYFLPLLEDHVHRDAGGAQAVEVGPEGRGDLAVPFHPGHHAGVIAVALEAEDGGGKGVDRGGEPVEVDPVGAADRVAAEGAQFLEEVEPGHIG